MAAASSCKWWWLATLSWCWCLLHAIPTAESAQFAYNETLAKTLVDFSAAAYSCTLKDCGNWQCDACLRHPHVELLRFHNETTGAHGFVAHDNGTIIVAFAGTDPLDFNAWVTNADWAKVPLKGCPNCLIHRGFHQLYHSIEPDFLDALNFVRKYDPLAPLYLTGHSLGGSLASVCAANLHFRHKITATALYTFGMPRVGDANYAEAMKTTLGAAMPIYRVIHNADPIPHFPPLLVDFVHFPTEILYNEDESSYTVCNPDFGEDLTCSDSFLFQYNPNDHMTYLGVPM